ARHVHRRPPVASVTTVPRQQWLSLGHSPPPFCVAPFFLYRPGPPRDLHSFPTRRSSDLDGCAGCSQCSRNRFAKTKHSVAQIDRSEEHTSELQSPCNLVCRLLLEKKNKKYRLSHLYRPPLYSQQL